MKIDFDAAITNLKGETLNERGEKFRIVPDGTAAQDGDDKMTLGFVAMTALNHGIMEEKNFKKATARYDIMKKAYGTAGGGVQEVSAADVVLIQEQLVKV